MEESVKAVTAEELESYKEELRITIEELRKQKPSAKAEKQDAKKADEELERLRKIVGDFHPGPKSPTYRTLYDENQKLKQDLKEQGAINSTYKTEIASLREQIEKQEKEILHLRNHSVQATDPAPEKLELEKKKISLRKKEVEKDPGKKPRSDKELRKDLQTLLFSPRFSDGQVELLAQILTKDKSLPTMVLTQLVDPRLTTDRMLTLYRLLCAQHHVEPVIEIPASATEQEKQEIEQEDNTDSGQDFTGQTSGQNCPDVVGKATSGSGGQNRGSIPHVNMQQRKGR